MKPDLDKIRVNTGKQCQYCGNDTAVVQSSAIYGQGSGNYGLMYWCQPCGAYVGCHKNTNAALGSVANMFLRKSRQEAHKAFDSIWKMGYKKRSDCYETLARHMRIPVEECHMAMMSAAQCKEVVDWAYSVKPTDEPVEQEPEDMEQKKGTVLSAEKDQFIPSRTPGTLGLQWWRVRLSDRPEYDLFIASSENEACRCTVGAEVNYTESKTNGGKPKLVPTLGPVDPAPRPNNPTAAQGGVSPQMSAAPPVAQAPVTPPVQQTAPAAPAKAAPPTTAPPAVTATVPPPADKPSTTTKLDSEVRTAKVLSQEYLKQWNPGDGTAVRFGWKVILNNGESGTTWTDNHTEPFTVGQEISYTFGKMYNDGSKRIDLAVTGVDGAVPRETTIMRVACLNSAIAYCTGILDDTAKATLKPEYILTLATQFEQHVTRTT